MQGPYLLESGSSGPVAITAFTKEYNVVAIVDQDECCASILGKLADITSS